MFPNCSFIFLMQFISGTSCLFGFSSQTWWFNCDFLTVFGFNPLLLSELNVIIYFSLTKQNKTFSYINCACETLRAQNVLRVSSKIELLMFDILVAFVILKWLHQLPVLPHTVLSCMTGGIVTLFKLWKEEKYPSSERERGREMEGGCEGRLEKTIIMVIGYGFVHFDRGGHIASALLW